MLSRIKQKIIDLSALFFFEGAAQLNNRRLCIDFWFSNGIVDVVSALRRVDRILTHILELQDIDQGQSSSL